MKNQTVSTATAREWAVAYITGDESFQQIAEREGVTKGVVNHQGTKGGWSKLRAQYRAAKLYHAVSDTIEHNQTQAFVEHC